MKQINLILTVGVIGGAAYYSWGWWKRKKLQAAVQQLVADGAQRGYFNVAGAKADPEDIALGEVQPGSRPSYLAG